MLRCLARGGFWPTTVQRSFVELLEEIFIIVVIVIVIVIVIKIVIFIVI